MGSVPAQHNYIDIIIKISAKLLSLPVVMLSRFRVETSGALALLPLCICLVSTQGTLLIKSLHLVTGQKESVEYARIPSKVSRCYRVELRKLANGLAIGCEGVQREMG